MNDEAVTAGEKNASIAGCSLVFIRVDMPTWGHLIQVNMFSVLAINLRVI